MVLYFSAACSIIFQKSSHFSRRLKHCFISLMSWAHQQAPIALISCNHHSVMSFPSVSPASSVCWCWSQLWPCVTLDQAVKGLRGLLLLSAPALGAECKLRTCNLQEGRVVGICLAPASHWPWVCFYIPFLSLVLNVESWNVLGCKVHKRSSYSNILPWAGTPSTNPACSGLHPAWPWTHPEMDHPSFLE